MLLASDRVVIGDVPEASPRTLQIDGDRIVAVRDGIDPAADVVDGWLVPGYVDIHCHGAAGADLFDADLDAVRRAIDHHRRHGTTSVFASLVSAPIDLIVEQVERLRPLVETGELAGVHIEGPFLSPERKGAHDETLLRDPDAADIARVVDACRGLTAQITLAAERPGGLDAVRACVAGGMRVAFGHSDADATQTQQAIDAGATIATHLFNAMRSIHHREPGPVPVLLDDDRVLIELICDGTHLSLSVAEMAMRAAGHRRVALITDAMSATGQPDGHCALGTLPVEVRDGVARLVTTDGSPGAIAGSTLTMGRAVALVVGQGVEVPRAAIMASATPAGWFGLDEVGQLAAGRYADACVVSDGGELRRVLRRGQWVDCRSAAR